MPRSRLTSFEHVLLGMIFIEPSSGYDLKRRFATTPIGLYQPSSGALYPALERLERRGLLQSEAVRPARGPARRVYRLTADGREAHLAWVREPVVPQTAPQDLGMHLVRFAMMVDVLPDGEVAEFLAGLHAGLASLVTALEQVSAGPLLGDNLGARLAVEHGLAVHKASLTWTERAMTALAERRAAS